MGEFKPLHPLLVFICVQNRVWSHVDNQNHRILRASGLVSGRQNEFKYIFLHTFSLDYARKTDNRTSSAAGCCKQIRQTPRTDTRRQQRLVRGRWECKPARVGSKTEAVSVQTVQSCSLITDVVSAKSIFIRHLSPLVRDGSPALQSRYERADRCCASEGTKGFVTV